MKTPDSNGKIRSPNLFPVVGVGASAGGLNAFRTFIKAIPEKCGMAFVLVQHLDPKHDSILSELLQKVTTIPVMEITDDMKVEPDHIYIIPSNKLLIANDGILELSPRPVNPKKEKNLPIDLFFTSLAEVHQSHAIGVVLSGNASDGTAGLGVIREHGGLTFAQDVASAAYSGMPLSASQAGVVDFILPPDKIPAKIIELHKALHRVGGDQQNIPVREENAFKQILALLQFRKGTDFSYYRKTTIYRRILRRMAFNKMETRTAYLDFLRASRSEQDLLYQDLLIPVTGFFRDPKSFSRLCSEVIPQIVKAKPKGEMIRIWVTACSTGEEAYSLAICFHELLSPNHEKIQVFATDISKPAMAHARCGTYNKRELAGVSASRLKQYFTRNNDDLYTVNKQVREMCVFAEHNFLQDPPFRRMDFISCRNVLIYMEPYLQKKALTIFHYALKSNGFLFLGRSETTNSVPELFSPVKKNEKLYTRNDVPVKYNHTAHPKGEGNMDADVVIPKAKTLHTDFQKTADDIILSKYTPAGVIVNDLFEIVQFRGNTTMYLEQLHGAPSHNLLKLARYGLSFELRTLLHKARKEEVNVTKENVTLTIDDSVFTISITAIPLADTVEPYYLVLFHDRQLLRSRQSSPQAKRKADHRDTRIAQLERELAQTHEDMRSITEDQEATNEVLQSDNEELSSSSEELQSLNEELETSKEELQSSNEELLVVNQEMVTLNEQLKAARDYAEAIVGTTREPLLVLDKSLRIKTANRSFYETFLMNSIDTEGQLLFEVGNQQWNIPSLLLMLEKIISESKGFLDFEVVHHFATLGTRTLLLNGREMAGEVVNEKLILLAIEDVTKLASARKKMQVQADMV
ncbi:MAG: histidine kinase, partial [Azospira oryzae]